MQFLLAFLALAVLAFAEKCPTTVDCPKDMVQCPGPPEKTPDGCPMPGPCMPKDCKENFWLWSFIAMAFKSLVEILKISVFIDFSIY